MKHHLRERVVFRCIYIDTVYRIAFKYLQCIVALDSIGCLCICVKLHPAICTSIYIMSLWFVFFSSFHRAARSSQCDCNRIQWWNDFRAILLWYRKVAFHLANFNDNEWASIFEILLYFVSSNVSKCLFVCTHTFKKCIASSSSIGEDTITSAQPTIWAKAVPTNND